MHLHKNYFHKMELNAYRPTKTFPISSSRYLLRTALLFGSEYFFFVVIVVSAFALLLHKILRFSKPIYVQYIILLPFFPPVFSAHTISYTWSRVAFFSLASHRHLSVITINRSINSVFNCFTTSHSLCLLLPFPFLLLPQQWYARATREHVLFGVVRTPL